MSSTRSRSASSARVLTLAAFAAWLSTKHPRTKVGLACESDSCPLSKFLTQTTGIPHRVGSESYEVAEVDADGKVLRDPDGEVLYGPERELPQWAQHFISQVDERDDYMSVSAARALRIVESNSLGRAARMTG